MKQEEELKENDTVAGTTIVVSLVMFFTLLLIACLACYFIDKDVQTRMLKKVDKKAFDEG